MSELYIGLMSGTSADGIDAALIDFSHDPLKVIATHYVPYSPPIRERILALYQPGENEIRRLGELDTHLGQAFAEAVQTLLAPLALPAHAITAIGSHGQTIRHHPARFTLQIGDPNVIAAQTGITTVADFRRRDMAHGGQGAPLVPAFHHALFMSSTTPRAIVNIGGIANVTLLIPHQKEVIGFDTGPGNVLLDEWIFLHQQETHDRNGDWAAQGTIHHALLSSLLNDPFFKSPPPKSTGRDYFHLAWLQNHLHAFDSILAEDVQATLVELTAISMMQAIRQSLTEGEILVCGGGIHNTTLLSRLRTLAAPSFTLHSTSAYGVDPDWVEATAFAWLARQTMRQQPGNLPNVTGAQKSVILGGIYHGA